jgi:hypothetical protein
MLLVFDATLLAYFVIIYMVKPKFEIVSYFSSASFNFSSVSFSTTTIKVLQISVPGTPLAYATG